MSNSSTDNSSSPRYKFDSTKFKRTRLIDELSSRFGFGSLFHPIIWIILVLYYSLHSQAYSQVFFITISLLILFTFVSRIAIFVWVKFTNNLNRYHLKLSLILFFITLTSLIWYFIFAFTILHTANENEFHLIIIITTLCIFTFAIITTAASNIARVILIAIFLLFPITVLLTDNDEKLIMATGFLLLIIYLNVLSKSFNKVYWAWIDNAVKREEQTVELEKLTQRLETLSQTDDLTKLYNRFYYTNYLEKEWHRAERENTAISIALLDIDHFKAINDNFGHLVGDLCLKKLSKTLQNNMRKSGDIVARYGGEEFVVLMPNTDEVAALNVAKRLMKAVRTIEISVEENEELLSMTCSIGLATLRPSYPQKHDENSLFHQADTALYHAKENGRNKIAVYNESTNKAVEEIQHQNAESSEIDTITI